MAPLKVVGWQSREYAAAIRGVGVDMIPYLDFVVNICREKAALAAHPLKSNGGCTFSTIRRCFLHDAHLLLPFDDKWVLS